MAPKTGGPVETVPKEFRCAATGKPLYLPVVTLHGVAYSYAALFEMFTTAQGAPKCKVTQEPIHFFPSVCVPLHHYMMSEFRNAMKARQQQDWVEMGEKFGLRMPEVSDDPDEDGDEGLLEEFECAVSKELAYEPCCLSSGTIVSAYCVPEGGFKKDPDRMIACALHGQAPQKSNVLEAMMKSKFPKEYQQRAADLAKQGTGKHATGTFKEFPPDDYIFWGLGCDGCGLWPIRGGAWNDTQCPDPTGFHLCEGCYQFNYHRRVIAGKFNQHHMPKHKMEEMRQPTFM